VQQPVIFPHVYPAFNIQYGNITKIMKVIKIEKMENIWIH
jgi:hypothetical protein